MVCWKGFWSCWFMDPSWWCEQMVVPLPSIKLLEGHECVMGFGVLNCSGLKAYNPLLRCFGFSTKHRRISAYVSTLTFGIVILYSSFNWELPASLKWYKKWHNSCWHRSAATCKHSWWVLLGGPMFHFTTIQFILIGRPIATREEGISQNIDNLIYWLHILSSYYPGTPKRVWVFWRIWDRGEGYYISFKLSNSC